MRRSVMGSSLRVRPPGTATRVVVAAGGVATHEGRKRASRFLQITLRSVELDAARGDPAGRILVAATLSLGARLLTRARAARPGRGGDGGSERAAAAQGAAAAAVYRSITRSMPRWQTRQNGTLLRLNMMQSICGRQEPRGA